MNRFNRQTWSFDLVQESWGSFLRYPERSYDATAGCFRSGRKILLLLCLCLGWLNTASSQTNVSIVQFNTQFLDDCVDLNTNGSGYISDCAPTLTISDNQGNNTVLYGTLNGPVFDDGYFGGLSGAMPLVVGQKYTCWLSYNLSQISWEFFPPFCGTALYLKSIEFWAEPEYQPPYDAYFDDPGYAFTMTLKPQYNIQGGGESSFGAQLLPADGVSQYTPALGDPSQSVSQATWFIYGATGPGDTNTLGCTVDGGTGVVTAGTHTGTIYLQAVSSNPSNCDCNNGAGNINDRIQIDLICSPNGTCAACNGSFGAASCAINSVDVAIGLGWSSLSGTAGALSITADYPDPSLATPQALRYNFYRPDVSVIKDGQGNLRQVNAPTGLADIITNSATQYSVNFYFSTNILGMTNGLYFTTGSPEVVVTVASPGADTNHLVVTQTRQGTDTVFDYQWVTNGWQLTTGGGLRQETKYTVWSQSNTVRTVTQIVKNIDGSVAKNGIETYQQFPTGEHLTQQIIGAGPNAQTNTYLYLTNGYLQQVVLANGSWQYFVYDSRNRPTNVFSSFGNQAMTTNPALCRLTSYDYSTNYISGSGDDGHLGLATPRQTVEYLEGQEVSRSYAVVLEDEIQNIRCVAPGASWNDTNNLVTTTMNYTYGIPHAGETLSVQQPDGTIEVYLYGNGYQNTTNVTLSGHPDSSGTNIDLGTRTVDVIGPLGLLQERTVYDVPSGYVTSSESYAYDVFNRLAVTTFLDGTYEQNTYDCCTLSSKLERDGSYTYYTYDALKRLAATTSNGITVSNVLDSEGNVLATVRYGTDGTAITNQVSTYDNADRLLASVDALGNLTTYTNYLDGSGQTIKQTTNPDLSTRIETYAVDGSLLNVSGTAVHGARYQIGRAHV